MFAYAHQHIYTLASARICTHQHIRARQHNQSSASNTRPCWRIWWLVIETRCRRGGLCLPQPSISIVAGLTRKILWAYDRSLRSVTHPWTDRCVLLVDYLGFLRFKFVFFFDDDMWVFNKTYGLHTCMLGMSMCIRCITILLFMYVNMYVTMKALCVFVSWVACVYADGIEVMCALLLLSTWFVFIAHLHYNQKI
jgi:hypothetical protein